MSGLRGKVVVVTGAGQGPPLVAFLIGDGSSFITGAEIPVDGGLTAHGGVTSLSDAVRTHS